MMIHILENLGITYQITVFTNGEGQALWHRKFHLGLFFWSSSFPHADTLTTYSLLSCESKILLEQQIFFKNILLFLLLLKSYYFFEKVLR